MKKHKVKSSRNNGSDNESCPTHQELQKAVCLFTEERYLEAEAMAKSMTVNFPKFGFCWTILGAVLMKAGRFSDALESMQKAVALSPDNYHAHNSLGMTLKLFGRLDEASSSFRRAIQIKPDHAEAHNNLGIIYLDRSRFNAAESCFLCAIQFKPDYAEAHNNLGLSLRNLGRLVEAKVCFIRALQFNPDSAEIHNNLGLALHDMGDLVSAETSFLCALGIRPNYAEAHNNLGITLRDQERLIDAQACFLVALEYKHEYPEAYYNLAITFQDQGRFEEAESSYRHVIRLKADFADAHNNLGEILLNLNRSEEARVSYLLAIELNPTYSVAYNNLGNALLKLGRLDEAEESYRRALHINPNYAEAHYNLGISLHSLGRPAETESCCRRAIELKPNYFEAHNNLGVTLYELGRPHEAEASYRRSIEINPEYPEAHNNLGNVFMFMGRLIEAEASYRRAIDTKPDFADAYSNCGSVLMELGKTEEAKNLIYKAIELAPGAARNLVIAMLYISFQQDDPRLKQLEAVYDKRESLPLEEKIRLNFAMGKAMENIGQYDRSFSAYEEGNRLHFQKHPFDEAEDDRFIEKLCAILTADLFKQSDAIEKTLPPIQDKRVPIFIVGMLRSGTTLIEQILASHPAVYGAGELTTMDDFVKKAKLITFEFIDWKEALLALRKLGQEYLDQLFKFAPDVDYISDKMPGNYVHLGLIHLMFPNAKIIHAMRDPMDTCFSCYAIRFTLGHEYSYDLGALGRQYLRYSKLMKHWHEVLPPGRILHVHYEDNISDPEQEARRMLEYLGLPWDPACLKFHESDRVVRTASVAQVRKPIYSSSVGRWKSFKEHLGLLFETIHQVGLNLPKVTRVGNKR